MCVVKWTSRNGGENTEDKRGFVSLIIHMHDNARVP
jgi:hypothetical protein